MNYYNKIKNELMDVEVYSIVKDYSKNKYTLEKYYNVGKMIIEAQGGEERAKYGDGIIREYSERLINEVGVKYNTTTLKRIRQFYVLIQKGAPLAHQLTWSHYVELLPIKDENELLYYLNISIDNNLSRNDLRKRIKSNEYERLPEDTRLKLATKEDVTLIDTIKNPILIKNKYNINDISEKTLQQLILENISSFLEELGEGFAFIKNEYKIKIGNRYNYIDLLLYNKIYRSYVVIELKATELKKEHIGQIQVYMNYIDEFIKTLEDNKTIGIIISKEDNKYVIKYCSDKRIISRTYQLV